MRFSDQSMKGSIRVKRLTKAVCFLMVAVMLFSTTAFAAESRASNFFAMTSTYLERVSSSTIDIWFDVSAVGRMDELGVRKIKLQRSTDRSNWSTIETYDMDDYGEMICEGTASHSGCLTYSSASTGYYYRAYVIFYAKNSSGIGEFTDYTATIT